MGWKGGGAGILAAMFVLMTIAFMDPVHAAEPELIKILNAGAKAEVTSDALPQPAVMVHGASLYVSFEKEGEVVVNHIAGKVLITYVVSDSPDPDSKTIEKGIYALRKHKDVVKDAEKQRAKDAKDLTEQKYKPAACIPSGGGDGTGLHTWPEMLILRDRPHITAPYPDPNFVNRCANGQCVKAASRF